MLLTGIREHLVEERARRRRVTGTPEDADRASIVSAAKTRSEREEVRAKEVVRGLDHHGRPVERGLARLLFPAHHTVSEHGELEPLELNREASADVQVWQADRRATRRLELTIPV